MSLLEALCAVDDFCQAFEPIWRQHLLVQDACPRQWASSLCLSEVMTICIHFHQSRYGDVKSYYQQDVQVHLRWEFPGLVSYSRMVKLMRRLVMPLGVYWVLGISERKCRLRQRYQR